MSLHKIIQHAIDNNPLKMKEAFEDEMTSRLRVALEEAYNGINEAVDTDKVEIEYKGSDKQRESDSEKYGIKIGAPNKDGKSAVTGDHKKVADFLAKHYGDEEEAKKKHPRVFSDVDSKDDEGEKTPDSDKASPADDSGSDDSDDYDGPDPEDMKQVAIQVAGAVNLKKIVEAMNEEGEVPLDEMLGFDPGDEDPEYKGGDTVVYPSSFENEDGLREIQQRCDYRTKLSDYTSKRISAHIKTGGNVTNWSPDDDDDKNIGYDVLYYNALLEDIIQPGGSGFTYRAKLI